jgi:hypothetical protein
VVLQQREESSLVVAALQRLDGVVHIGRERVGSGCEEGEALEILEGLQSSDVGRIAAATTACTAATTTTRAGSSALASARGGSARAHHAATAATATSTSAAATAAIAVEGNLDGVGEVHERSVVNGLESVGDVAGRSQDVVDLSEEEVTPLRGVTDSGVRTRIDSDI